MADLSLDEMVQALRDRVEKPGRLREPRRAIPLAEVDPAMVPTPHGRVAAWRAGAGAATMLVHGWQDDTSLWSPMIAALEDAGEAYVAFDLPAHGFSEGEGGLTFEVADALHAVAESLGPLRGLVAHSFAGGASVLATSEGLPISRLVLIAPPLYPVSKSRYHRVAEDLGYPVEVAERAMAEYFATTSADRAGYDMPTWLAALDAPVLLVSGVDDERMAVDEARNIAPKLQRGELFEVDKTNHRQTARDPRVIARVIEFLTTDTQP
jgi:pimeloyl-ACP methyl ester carboxylesterase